MFVINDIKAVATPFGAGCSHIVTWPRRYHGRGEIKVALGAWDPSCRKYHKTEELSFVVASKLFGEMLDRWRESFLTTKTWQLCMKKVALNETTWRARK